MNWESYEEVVKEIYEKLGAAAGVRIICHGRGCTVKGRSGVIHQIDVLTEHSDGVHSYRTAIECKFRDSKRPKDDVAKLATIVTDCGLHRGVLVSKEGFTPDAIAFAQQLNISLVELRKPTDEDWKGRVKDIHINLHLRIPRITDFTFEITAPDPEMQTGGTIDPIVLTVLEPGRPPVTVRTIIDEIIAKADGERTEIATMRRDFANGTTLSRPGGEQPVGIRAVEFKLQFERTQESISIRGEDHVAMIMKSVFENRRFVVSGDGEIRESDAR